MAIRSRVGLLYTWASSAAEAITNGSWTEALRGNGSEGRSFPKSVTAGT